MFSNDQYWGRGMATKDFCTDEYAFHELGVRRLIAMCESPETSFQEHCLRRVGNETRGDIA